MWGSAPKARHSSRWCSASYPLSANTVRMRAMTAKAARNSRSKARVSLTLAAVAAQATGTPSPSTATCDQQGVDLRQQAGLGPVRQAASQGRAAGLIFRGGQTAPWRALAQEAAQGGHDPDGHRGRVTAPTIAGSLAGVDHRRDE